MTRAGARFTLPDVRTELLSVRLSRSELAALDRVATRVSRSELVRIWILAADQMDGVHGEPPPLQPLAEVLAEFERDFPRVSS
jgi:hypothetical protein